MDVYVPVWGSAGAGRRVHQLLERPNQRALCLCSANGRPGRLGLRDGGDGRGRRAGTGPPGADVQGQPVLRSAGGSGRTTARGLGGAAGWRWPADGGAPVQHRTDQLLRGGGSRGRRNLVIPALLRDGCHRAGSAGEAGGYGTVSGGRGRVVRAARAGGGREFESGRGLRGRFAGELGRAGDGSGVGGG